MLLRPMRSLAANYSLKQDQPRKNAKSTKVSGGIVWSESSSPENQNVYDHPVGEGNPSISKHPAADLGASFGSALIQARMAFCTAGCKGTGTPKPRSKVLSVPCIRILPSMTVTDSWLLRTALRFIFKNFRRSSARQ